MKVGLAALHFPFAEHRDEMVSRVHRAAEVIAAAPGCLAVDCWVSEDQQAAVTTGQRESDPALRAGFAAVRTAGGDFDYAERESRPRQVCTRASASATAGETAASVRGDHQNMGTQPASPPGLKR